MVDLEEPIGSYPEVRAAHQQAVSDYFEGLVRISQVDEALNAETVANLRALEKGLGQGKAALRLRRVARVIAIVVGAGLLVTALGNRGLSLLLLIPAVAIAWYIVKRLNPEIASRRSQVAALTVERDSTAAEAQAQMAPLNSLYTWDDGLKLVQAAIPSLRFDRYLTARRLNDLFVNYGLPVDLLNNGSVLDVQGGHFNGNPFAITRYQYHWMGSRVYTGSIVIHWTESVRNSDGDWVEVQRSQTLTATVVKPFPEYSTRTVLLYGHESGPNLAFSRQPSRLSGGDGKVNGWRKEQTVKRVERKSRKQTRRGTGDLTVMANREFEALFKAIDRTHEIEFRMLFTALAQQEMVELLNDDSVGYGDNFSFAKQGKFNMLESRHMASMSLSTDPRSFASLSLADARQNFLNFHTEFLRAIYFAFAPLWTIPIYHDQRSLVHSEDIADATLSSAWDHETMANFIGEGTFRHPSSVTTNVLKAAALSVNSGAMEIAVDAHGYEGIPQIDIVPMTGGDGNVHPVPVHWTEYVPVVRRSSMIVGSLQRPPVAGEASDDVAMQDAWSAALRSYGVSPDAVIVRGALAAALLG